MPHQKAKLPQKKGKSRDTLGLVLVVGGMRNCQGNLVPERSHIGALVLGALVLRFSFFFLEVANFVVGLRLGRCHPNMRAFCQF